MIRDPVADELIDKTNEKPLVIDRWACRPRRGG